MGRPFRGSAVYTSKRAKRRAALCYSLEPRLTKWPTLRIQAQVQALSGSLEPAGVGVLRGAGGFRRRPVYIVRPPRVRHRTSSVLRSLSARFVVHRVTRESCTIYIIFFIQSKKCSSYCLRVVIKAEEAWGRGAYVSCTFSCTIGRRHFRVNGG